MEASWQEAVRGGSTSQIFADTEETPLQSPNPLEVKGGSKSQQGARNRQRDELPG